MAAPPAFNVMIKAWTRDPDPTGVRGTVAATMDKMDDDEARKWLEEVLSLYTETVERDARRRGKP